MGGGIVLDKEFEFKPSFDEYLKALESVKTDTDNGSNISSPTKKKIIKKTVQEEKNDDARANAQEESRKGASQKKNVFVQEDSRKGLKKSPELIKRTQNVNVKNLGAKRSGSAESKMRDLERAAFKPLENEDDFTYRHQKSIFIAKTENVALEQLMKSCEEFLTTQGATIDLREPEVASRSHSETAFVF